METISFVFCRRYEDFSQFVFEFFWSLMIEYDNYSRKDLFKGGNYYLLRGFECGNYLGEETIRKNTVIP